MITLPNPFLTRGARDKHKSVAYKRAPKQEKAKAARLGGFPIHGSGRGNKKGDVIVNNLARIECKNTQADSFRVTKEMIRKIEEAGLPNGEIPFISIEFIDARGKKTSGVSIISDIALETLFNRLKDAESK